MRVSPFSHSFVLSICLLWLCFSVDLASTERAPVSIYDAQRRYTTKVTLTHKLYSSNHQSNILQTQSESTQNERATYVQFHDLINVTGPVSGRMKREIRRTPYTDEEKQRMVDIHNKYRSETDAADMLKMKWDDDLEKAAQAWANQCQFEHPSAARTAGEFSPLGQNLHAITAGPPSPEDTVKGWYREIKDYTYSDSDGCAPDKLCGHYTQVIWASTHSIGCAINYCEPLTSTSVPIIFSQSYMVVCDYGPAGNYRTQFPYAKGEACSKCPDDRKICDNKLCTAPSNNGARFHQPMSLAMTTKIWSFVLTAVFGVKMFLLS